MAADDEQALLAFLADLGEGDDPVDAADPDDAQEATHGPKQVQRRPSLAHKMQILDEAKKAILVAGIRGVG